MKKRLKILQLINVRWFNACAWYALNLSRGLRERGHKVIVAGNQGSPVYKRAEKYGLPVVNLPLGRVNPYGAAVHLFRLKSLIKGSSVDVVNAHRGEGHSYASLLRGFQRVPLVRTRGDQRPPLVHPLNLLLHRWLTDMVIIPSPSLRPPLLKLGLGEEELEVIPPGVDTAYFQPKVSSSEAKVSLGLDGLTPLVGMIGRLSPVKGHRFFIDAASQVVREWPKVRFLIAGEDAQIKSRELRSLARSKGVFKNFVFLPYQKEVRNAISALDLGVVASVGSETICRVALEFMAMGKPVVGTRVNSIPYLIADGLNGIVVPPAAPQAMAQAILELLQDKDKRDEFGREARRRVEEEFSLERLAESTERLYYDLL